MPAVPRRGGTRHISCDAQDALREKALKAIKKRRKKTDWESILIVGVLLIGFAIFAYLLLDEKPLDAVKRGIINAGGRVDVEGKKVVWYNAALPSLVSSKNVKAGHVFVILPAAMMLSAKSANARVQEAVQKLSISDVAVRDDTLLASAYAAELQRAIATKASMQLSKKLRSIVAKVKSFSALFRTKFRSDGASASRGTHPAMQAYLYSHVEALQEDEGDFTAVAPSSDAERANVSALFFPRFVQHWRNVEAALTKIAAMTHVAMDNPDMEMSKVDEAERQPFLHPLTDLEIRASVSAAMRLTKSGVMTPLIDLARKPLSFSKAAELQLPFLNATSAAECTFPEGNAPAQGPSCRLVATQDLHERTVLTTAPEPSVLMEDATGQDVHPSRSRVGLITRYNILIEGNNMTSFVFDLSKAFPPPSSEFVALAEKQKCGTFPLSIQLGDFPSDDASNTPLISLLSLKAIQCVRIMITGDIQPRENDAEIVHALAPMCKDILVSRFDTEAARENLDALRATAESSSASRELWKAADAEISVLRRCAQLAI